MPHESRGGLVLPSPSKAEIMSIFGEIWGNVKQRRKLLLEMLSWDASGKSSCPYYCLVKNPSQLNNKTALHEDTDLIMDCYGCIFSNKSFFPTSIPWNIYIYTRRIECQLFSNWNESLSLCYLWQTNKSNQKGDLGPRLHCSLPLVFCVLFPQTLKDPTWDIMQHVTILYKDTSTGEIQ